MKKFIIIMLFLMFPLSLFAQTEIANLSSGNEKIKRPVYLYETPVKISESEYNVIINTPTDKIDIIWELTVNTIARTITYKTVIGIDKKTGKVLYALDNKQIVKANNNSILNHIIDVVK